MAPYGTFLCMAEYRRWYVRGGTYFFTLVTAGRAPIFASELGKRVLRETLSACAESRPFKLTAIVLLPDHLHMMWTLPPGDVDYSTRMAWLKSNFSRSYLSAGGTEQLRSASRVARGNRGVWQRRFWEHVIRDETDFERHLDYIHFNPVKHGHAKCPHDWPHSSFEKWVAKDVYQTTWGCSCEGRPQIMPNFDWADELELE